MHVLCTHQLLFTHIFKRTSVYYKLLVPCHGAVLFLATSEKLGKTCIYGKFKNGGATDIRNFISVINYRADQPCGGCVM